MMVVKMKKIYQSPLPYYDERLHDICALVLHCSTHDADEMVEVLREKQLSSHYIIGLDGKIIQPVDDAKRAWHAGVSRWREMDNLNHYSIGIEISSPSMGQESYRDAQICNLIWLCRRLIRKYRIPPVNVVAHSDVAPQRKPDPGLMFPWQYLADSGVGLWYDLSDAKKVSEDDPAKLLSVIGYNIENISAASYAFCRHFLPQLVEKCSDIKWLLDNVYPSDYVFPLQYINVLKACAYKYSLLKNTKMRSIRSKK